jgi:hypothetical protein
MKYKFKYEYTNDFGTPRHTWSLVGAKGGLHLHISELKTAQFEDEKYSGGIEIHYRYPPEYRENDAPSHNNCWLLGCPCWHDGSSLQVSEIWIPLWKVDKHDHDRMFGLLAGDFEQKLKNE